MSDYILKISRGGGPVANGVYNVLAYGATGDGTTDDSSSIQAAIDAAEAAGSGIVHMPPSLDYYVETGLTLNPTSTSVPVTIEAYGATITAPYTLNGPILQVGTTGALTRKAAVRGGLWTYNSVSAWDNSANVCIRLLNASYCRIDDVEVRRGYYGLQLDAEEAYYCAYSETYSVEYWDCLNAISLNCRGNTSWINENMFSGGGIHYSSTMTDATAGFAMGLQHAGASPTHYMNNNRFLDITAECGMVNYDITAATQASPCVVTMDTASHILAVGDTARIFGVVGMTDLNGTHVIEAVSATTITLTVDASGFDAWSSGGNASSKPVMIHDEHGFWNSFVRIRSELFPEPKVTFGTDTRELWYQNGVEVNVSDIVADANLKKISILTSKETSFPGGTATAPVMRLFNVTSANSPSFAIGNADASGDRIILYGNGAQWFFPTAGSGVAATEGMIHYHTTPNRMKVYTGAAWETITTDVAVTATATDDDDTPTVAGIRHLLFEANTNPLAITQLDNGVAGQEIILIGTSATNSPTIVDGGNFSLDGTTWTGSVDETLHLVTVDGSAWIEVSRSTN